MENISQKEEKHHSTVIFPWYAESRLGAGILRNLGEFFQKVPHEQPGEAGIKKNLDKW